MSSTNSSAPLRQSGATATFRPGAVARTPFGTAFFKLDIDPNTDTGTFVKQRLSTKTWEEIRAWEKLQRFGKLPENRSYAAILQRHRFADDAASTSATERVVGGAGFEVGGAGYPSYFVPVVDAPRDKASAGEAPVVSTDNHGNDDGRLWPDTYSIVSDSDIDYILDDFVVIDMADATGSVFWNQPRRFGTQFQIVRGERSPSFWSRILSRLRPFAEPLRCCILGIVVM